MRVKTLTLATAALSFGLAAPALASSTLDSQGLRSQVLLQRGGDDCGDGGGCGDSDSFSSHRHCGSGAGCGRLFGGGPFSAGGFGGFGGGGFGGGGFGGGGGGDRVEYGESGHFCCAAKHARVHARVAAPRMARPGVVMHRRQVVRVPVRAVPTGFGGSQGMNLPLGIAGLSLVLGGAGLLPLARRRIRASERS